MTILILGVISITAIPRLLDRGTFDSRGFYDRVIATIRYAQKAAIAKHRHVCVTIASDTVTLSYGTNATCTAGNGPLLIPPDKPNIKAPAGVTVTATTFSFDSLGKPSAVQSIAVSGSGTITVEAETGYVH